MGLSDRRLQEMVAAVEGPDRFRDLELHLRRAKTGETLLAAGGRWDSFEETFIGGAHEGAVILLEESQVEFTLWFAEFLADYRDGFFRDISAALMAGDRRAGKTFDAYYCQIAALIDVPMNPTSRVPTIGWTVSKTFRERDELDELMDARIPGHWYHAMKAPEHRYNFVHGAVLRNLSADDPDSLKQGKVDFLLYNEVQKMAARAVVNGIFGTADQAGLCIMTANKPREDSRGEWLFDLKEAIDDELKSQTAAQNREKLGVKFFGLSSKNNTKIDQPARKRVGKIAAIIDPTTAEADDDDGTEWKRPGEFAFWEFDKHRDVHATPRVGAVDVTRQLAQMLFYGDWDAVAGIDFQAKPNIPATVIRCFGDPDRPIYWFVDEFVERGRQLTEQRFLEGFEERFGPDSSDPRYTRDNLLWVCDASSFWQGARHDFEGEELPSADYFEGDGWAIVPSQAPAKNSKTGRARNPPVDQRLQLFNELLRQNRIKFDPHRVPWLLECARLATTQRLAGRRNLVGNQYAHMIDAATYPIWRLERRPTAPRPTASDITLVKTGRRGDR